MGGPQLRSAIRVSREIRARFPCVPIIWGGHFPSICAEPALNTPYLDYAIRGQGEDTLREVLDAVFIGGRARRDSRLVLALGRSDRSQQESRIFRCQR